MDKVVSLAEYREKRAQEHMTVKCEPDRLKTAMEDAEAKFKELEETMKKNQENEERMKRERAKTNRSTLRSNRLKT